MSDVTNNETTEKLYDKFQLETQDILTRESNNGRLVESGQPLLSLREITIGLTKTADAQTDALSQVKLFSKFASEFIRFSVLDLAMELLEMALVRCDNIPDEIVAVRYQVDVLQRIVKVQLSKLNSMRNCRIAPMSASKLLVLLQRLRKTLETIFALTVCHQEELAWLVLNSCRLVMEVGQPLVWFSCGKYVTETMLFAGLCMESVINLCTVRHMRFRMKVYSTAFYAAVAQGSLDEARGVLEHTARQVRELRDREQIDPPVPEPSLRCLEECDCDVAVMRVVADFWRDPDGLDLTADGLAAKYFRPTDPALLASTQSFSDRAAAECIRVHLLASGNVNEVYRKRSSCLLRAVAATIAPYKVPGQAAADNESSGSAIVQMFTAQSLLEIATVAVFEATEGVDLPELLGKLWSLAAVAATRGDSDEAGRALNGSEVLADVEMLRNLSLLAERGPEDPADCSAQAARIQLLSAFLSSLQSAVYSAYAYRRQALIRRATVHLWARYIYPAVQAALSSFNAGVAMGIVAEITPAVAGAVRALDLARLEDPVLLAGIALLAGNFLWVTGDLRGPIAMLRQAVSAVDEQRAARVDVRLHQPEDPRDVYALQRAAFTARADEQDWFHSVKRLGAHAFAGYGIFGLSSSADRSDSALAEMHADLVALYFRFEMEYAVRMAALRSSVKQATAVHEKDKAKALNATVAFPTKVTAKKDAALGKSASKVATIAERTMRAVTMAEDANATDAGALAVVPALRSFCAKNAYYRCLLLLEMARADGDEERRRDFLREAAAAIEECEGRERGLKDGFKQLLVMTNASRTYPLVLARSHRYLYVAPVGCRAQSKASYYRIFAKETGSGTDVSAYNDDISGCERRVPVRDLRSLRDSVVRVGPLRQGELYVVGCMAFAHNDSAVGSISPTSPIVEAVNPLPTIMLWSLLNQTASEVCGLGSLTRAASQRVTDRYFLSAPHLQARSVGKGANLFLFPEPALCMLALQQSSPLLLHSFATAFVTSEIAVAATAAAASEGPGASAQRAAVHWVMRRPKQLAKLVSLHRTAAVTKVASGTAHHDLTLQCAKLGYSLAADLLRFDAVHMAQYLQGPLCVFTLAMQGIAKRNWRALEHKLYCRILAAVVRVAVLNRNLGPAMLLLNEFYPESVDRELAASSLPHGDLLHLYLALAGLVQQCIAPAHLTGFAAQMGALHSVLTPEAHAAAAAGAGGGERVGYLWAMSAAQRRARVTGAAVDFVTPPAEKSVPSPEKLALETWLTAEKPRLMSDLMRTVLIMGRELLAGDRPALWPQLLAKVAIYAEYVVPEVRSAHADWGLSLLRSVSDVPKPVSPRSGAASKKKPAGKPDPNAPADAPPEDPLHVPERFQAASREEAEDQLAAMGELLYLSAVACCPAAALVNHFPRSAVGPGELLDPTSAAVSGETEVQLPSLLAASAPLSDSMSRSDFVRHVGAAVDMFQRAGAHSSAVLAATRLWNFVSADWLDPEAFALEFADIQPCLHRTLSAVVQLMEALSFFEVQSRDPDDDEDEGEDNVKQPAVSGIEDSGPRTEEAEGEADPDGGVNQRQEVFTVGGRSGLTRREVKEHLVLCRELAVFLLKAQWLAGQHAEVVRLGSALFQLYSLNCPEHCKRLGDHCLPLVMHSQETLLSRAEAFQAARQQDLDAFVAAYEEAQRKKRKKKLRIARTDKDEEELVFDAECAAFQAKIDAAREQCERCRADLAAAQAQQKRFDTMYSTGTQLLDKVKASSAALLQDMRAQFGPDVDLRSLAGDEDAQDRVDVVMHQFAQVSSFLREKKERQVLLEALKAQGDLLLLFGRLQQVRQIWHDAVDGLFNAIDATQDWPAVCRRALDSLEPSLVPGILPVVVVLGKLSRYCVSGDLDAKAGYCRMAAELCRIPFQESYGHPQTTVGFAAYVCQDLGGLNSLGADTDALTAHGLAVALEEVCAVLLAERQLVSILPVVVLWEHLCTHFLRSPAQWLRARLTRVKSLVRGHHFAEAASMLAAVKPTVAALHGQSFHDPMREQSAGDSAALAAFETSLNGLNFYGMAPFLNNQTPEHEGNGRAVDWIKALPSDFEQFARPYRVLLPEKVLSPEEAAAAEEQAAKAVAEAAELAIKSKGAKKGSAPADVPATPPANSVAMFDEVQVADVFVTAGMLLLELGSLDRQRTAPQSPGLAQIAAAGVDLLSKAATALQSCATEDTVRSARWLQLYGTCQLQLSGYKLLRCRYRECRAAATKFLDFLQSGLFDELAGDAKYALCQHWFAANDLLATVAHRQARFADAAAQATQCAAEASMVYAGRWLRSFLLLRGRTQFKLGRFSESLQSLDACVAQCELNHVRDLVLVRCLALKAAVIRERAVHGGKQQAVSAFVSCIELLRESRDIAQSLAFSNGSHPADSNVTYTRADTMVQTHHAMPPMLDSLTARHNNEPILSLTARTDDSRVSQWMGAMVVGRQSSSSSTTDGPQTTSCADSDSDSDLRLGPVDASAAVYSPSEFVNIYLEESRALVTAAAALFSVLDDFRCSGAHGGLTLRHSLEGDTAADELLSSLEPQAVLDEQEQLAESALKLLRQCVYASPVTRTALLIAAGKTRVAKASKCSAVSESQPPPAETLFAPFAAALDVAVTSSAHPWELIRSACVQLVEAHGDPLLDLGEADGDLRLQTAVVYLTAAVKAGNQRAALTSDSIGLSDDPAFEATALPEELLALVTNASSSSATVPRPDAATEVAQAAVPTKGAASSKAAKGAAPPATTASGPSGRDALFLLSSLLREADPLWLDGAERDLAADLQGLLRGAYPVYAARCSFDKPPDPKAAVCVAQTSVSALWVPARTPDEFAAQLGREKTGTGLYSHTAAFFLLGDRKLRDAATAATTAPAPTAKGKKPDPNAAQTVQIVPSAAPVLTRVVLSRADVAFVERRLRDVRDRFLDAQAKRFVNALQRAHEEFGETLCQLVGLLKTGVVAGRDSADNGSGSPESALNPPLCTYSLADSAAGPAGAKTLALTVSAPTAANAQAKPSTMQLTVSERLMLNLATVLRADRDTDALMDDEVCAVVRAALGYGGDK